MVFFCFFVSVSKILYLQCRRGGLRVSGQLKFSRGRRPAAGQETEGGVGTHLRIVLIAVLPSANEQWLVTFRIPPLARQLFRYGRYYRQGTVNHGCQLSKFWFLGWPLLLCILGSLFFFSLIKIYCSIIFFFKFIYKSQLRTLASFSKIPGFLRFVFFQKKSKKQLLKVNRKKVTKCIFFVFKTKNKTFIAILSCKRFNSGLFFTAAEILVEEGSYTKCPSSAK